MPLPTAFSLEGNKHHAHSAKVCNVSSEITQEFKIIFIAQVNMNFSATKKDFIDIIYDSLTITCTLTFNFTLILKQS
jgi:hypothetical protein